MDYIEQMLNELGDGAELVIRVDGRELRGYIYQQIGGERIEWLSVTVSLHQLDPLIGTLNEQAEEWLLEQGE